MMGRLDWEKILAIYTLGGYSNDAVLSNSTALLSLTGLTLMQEPWLWDDYELENDIQAAIALAIDEIVNGTAGHGDMIKIAEAVATADCAYLTLDNFDEGTYHTYELVIQGLKSNYAGFYLDHVKMQLNGGTTITDYVTYGYIMQKGVYVDYEWLGNYAGIPLVWAAPTSTVDNQSIGDAKVNFSDPQGDDYKRCTFVTSSFTGSASKTLLAQGSAVYGKTNSLTSIKILPDLGTLFKIDPASSLYPSELRLTLYGLQ